MSLSKLVPAHFFSGIALGYAVLLAIATADAPTPRSEVLTSKSFRLSVRQIASVRCLETKSHYTIITLNVSWNPALQPLLLQAHPQDVIVQDGKGAKLNVPEQGSSMAPVDGRSNLLVEMRLPGLDRSVRKLSLVKGTLSAIGPKKMQEFDFGLLSDLQGQRTPATLKQEQTTVQVGKITLDRARWTIQVTAQLPSGGPMFESFQSRWVNNEAYLVDKKGKRLPVNGGYNVVEAEGNRATFTYHFIDDRKRNLIRGDPAQWKLVYRCPAGFVEVKIPFEFKDLQLP